MDILPYLAWINKISIEAQKKHVHGEHNYAQSMSI